jgi:Ser/Thr protein kinase RdoA (MazF antagonist)
VQARVGRVDPDALAAAASYPQARDANFRPVRGGLINQTWAFDGPEGQGILQRLHPIFGAELHHDIEAITRQLVARGMETPRLLQTREGRLWVDGAEGSIWRALSFVPGVSMDRADAPAPLREAGALLGRFHRALADMDHEFHFQRAAVHDTDAHLVALTAIADRSNTGLAAVRALADRILGRAAALRPLPTLPLRVLHGDPKLNNIRFDETGQRAVCLIDLDTLRRGPLAHDLGDAWRSWCNRAGEDEGRARFDLGYLDAAARGYASTAEGLVTPAEAASLLVGLERISLELAARFCTDAFEDCYFGWDPDRYPSRRAHNLVRADGQLSLHDAVVAKRDEAQRVVGRAFSAAGSR